MSEWQNFKSIYIRFYYDRNSVLTFLTGRCATFSIRPTNSVRYSYPGDAANEVNMAARLDRVTLAPMLTGSWS